MWRHSCAPGAGAGPAERAVRAVELLASFRFASPRLLSPAPLSPASKCSTALSLCGRQSAAGGAAMAAGSALRAGAGLGAACWGERPLRPSFCCYLCLLPALPCPAHLLPQRCERPCAVQRPGAGCGGALSSARRAAFVCLRQLWGTGIPSLSSYVAYFSLFLNLRISVRIKTLVESFDLDFFFFTLFFLRLFFPLFKYLHWVN